MRIVFAFISILASAFVAAPAIAVEVYLFKGAGDFSIIHKNLHFSRGLDAIAKQLNANGIRAEVRGFAQAEEALRLIRKRRPGSVAFVGHSMGALASMALARRMKAEGIKVAYVATLDIPGPIGAAGSNVGWAENYYSMTPVYGVLTNTRSHRKAKNIYVFGTHTTMDDSRKVRQGVVAAIRNIHAQEKGLNSVSPSAPDEPALEMVMALQTEETGSNAAVQAIETNIPIPQPRSLQPGPTPKPTETPEDTQAQPIGKKMISGIVYTAKEINRRIASAHLWPPKPVNLLKSQ